MVQLGPYPPNTLARESLPSKLRAGNLFLDEGKVSPDSWDIPNPLSMIVWPYTVLRFSEDASHPLNSAHRKDYGNGEGPESRKDVMVSHEEDEKTQLLSQGLTLLLAARERVLTLSEQRVSPFSLSTYGYLFFLFP